METKALEVGFNIYAGKADTIQYILIFETLKILLSKEDIFVMDTRFTSSIGLLYCILLL